jgi:CO/xanthine dehydrogenase FAD-binding subunit
VKPAPFAYYDPTTIDEAVSLLAEHGSEAKVLAGGQSLMPLLNMRLARPAVVVDVNRVDGLDYIRQENGGLAIGALTRQRSIERSDVVARTQPLLAGATRLIAHPQIRNRGTVGGSIAHADPAAEYPAVALALDAEMRVAGPRGARAIQAEEFFVTYLTTALEPDELVTEVRLPALPPRTGWSVMELSRRHGDFALAGVAATLTLASNGECARARIVLFGFGVGPTSLRAIAAEQLLPGARLSDALVDAAADSAAKAIEEPLSDIHASGDYRRHLARVLTKRALVEAAGRAQEAS